MDPVDITFALLLGYAIVRGYSRGLLGTVVSYVAPVLGFMIATDWSDPVRDRLAEVVPAPELVLDLMAPALVFLAVVIALRIVSSLLARLLGVGMSVPSRLLAGTSGGVVTAVMLGVFVTLIHELAPTRGAAPDDAGEVVAAPVQNLLVSLDRRLAASRLAPPLAEMVESVVGEALPLVTGTANVPRPTGIPATGKRDL